jgi:hypothetical protein
VLTRAHSSSPLASREPSQTTFPNFISIILEGFGSWAHTSFRSENRSGVCRHRAYPLRQLRKASGYEEPLTNSNKFDAQTTLLRYSTMHTLRLIRLNKIFILPKRIEVIWFYPCKCLRPSIWPDKFYLIDHARCPETKV